MKYRDLNIQTQREAPNNARTEGFSFLVRAGYLTRENVPTQLGEHTINHLADLQANLVIRLLSGIVFQRLAMKMKPSSPLHQVPSKLHIVHPANIRNVLSSRALQRPRFHQEEPLLLEKILTPDCNTIEALANFLSIPKEKTAKALMYTRVTDNKFVFVVVRGDMQLSEAKLKQHIGDIRPATTRRDRKLRRSRGLCITDWAERCVDRRG